MFYQKGLLARRLQILSMVMSKRKIKATTQAVTRIQTKEKFFRNSSTIDETDKIRSHIDEIHTPFDYGVHIHYIS